MNFIESYKYSIKDISDNYSIENIRKLATKYSIPFITKKQVINIIAYLLLKPLYMKNGTMDTVIDVSLPKTNLEITMQPNKFIFKNSFYKHILEHDIPINFAEQYVIDLFRNNIINNYNYSNYCDDYGKKYYKFCFTLNRIMVQQIFEIFNDFDWITYDNDINKRINIYGYYYPDASSIVLVHFGWTSSVEKQCNNCLDNCEQC